MRYGMPLFIFVFIFGDNSTYRETVSILNYSRCLRLADIKTWK